VVDSTWWLTASFNTLQTTWLENDWFQNQIINDLYGQRILVDLWQNNIRLALRNMTAQLIAANVQMTGAIGGMMDAQTFNRTKLEIQTLHAQAVKDYTPGENLCRFGTNTRSLATATERMRTTYIAMAEMAQQRQLGTRGGSADVGPTMDRKARLDQFKRLYCDPADNNGDLRPLCYDGATPTSIPARFNKDINYTRTIDTRNTLDLDFANNGSTADEEDVIALSSNLYGHDVFSRLTEINFRAASGNDANKAKYLDIRQLVALRNVAQSSFNNVVAMRGRGGAGTATFMRSALQEMGMSEPEARQYLSGATGTSATAAGEPSYYAQMEILTKKLYQNPNFYTNLIDKPANVDRQHAAMEAFGLMQDRDIFQSIQRQEMLLSLLLEMKVRKEQDEVTRKLKQLGSVK
jgi:hypothetical protein